RQARIGLKERKLLEVGGDRGIGTAAVALGEIAFQFARREGSDVSLNDGLRQALALVARKEEEAVLAVKNVRDVDRPADGRAELIPVQDRLGNLIEVVEKRNSVEGVVPDEVIGATVPVVRAGSGHDADNAGAVAPVLCGVVAGEEFKLSDRVGIGVVHDAVVEQVVVHAAVEQEGDGIGAPASDTNTAGGSAWTTVGHARLEQGQGKHVAAVERQVMKRPAGDGLAERGDHGLDRGSERVNLHRFGHRSHPHFDVEAQRLIDVERLHLGYSLLKTGLLRSHRIVADRDVQHLEATINIGRGLARDSGCRVRDGDLSAGDHGPRWVGYRAHNPARSILSNDRAGPRKQKTSKQHTKRFHDPPPWSNQRLLTNMIPMPRIVNDLTCKKNGAARTESGLE